MGLKQLWWAFVLSVAASGAASAEDWSKRAVERDIVLKDFAFTTGERTDVRMHVHTLGTPHRISGGQIDNAIMVLHGTGGDGTTFFRTQFADELFGPGQPLDISRYYLILPDDLGHGRSSKPSDGLRMRFPHYGYADMVAAQKRMLEEGLGVHSLQLIFGTSMGCMHAFVWGTTYPGFAQRLAPFACNAVEVAGRNRTFRKMMIDEIEDDPVWNGGNYSREPEVGRRAALDIQQLAVGNPLAWQVSYPTREAADAALAEARVAPTTSDANDMIYWMDASRDYNPSALLSRITVPVLWVNSGDDFINPPELGFAQQQVKQMPRARFVLIPASTETKGHSTHTWAKFWKDDLAMLLAAK